MKIKGAGLSQIKITGGFWKEYQDLIFQEVIPYQWEILNDRIEGAEKSFTNWRGKERLWRERADG